MNEPPARYFEDFPIGFISETSSCEMTEEAIVAFASMYDPQPFHLDPRAAAESVFGRLVASGWHTSAVTMKLLVGSGIFRATGMIGLGVDELRWPRAVYPGDVLRVRTEVIESTLTKSGTRGTLRWSVTTLNHNNEIVQSMTTLLLVPARPK